MAALEGWMRYVLAISVLLIAACAAPSAPSSQSGSGQRAEQAPPRAPKKITAAILANFHSEQLINTAVTPRPVWATV